MVKIKNIFGDEYQGKQKNAVYQKRYGKQIRRIKEDKKRNDAPAQREQQQRFKVGLSWYSSLSYVEKEGLQQFLNERGIQLTPQQYAIKIALDRGKVSKVVSQEQIIAYDYVEGWHAVGWPYRQRITISNGNSYDLTDYQVKIILDGSNVGQNFDWSRGGADLRFFDEAGNKLSYWLEKWDEVNKQAVVWVKVKLIKANSSITIYMYYGNTAAQSESDGNAVFEFFDDFEGTSLDTSKWEAFASGGNYSVANSYVTLSPVPNQTNAVALRSNVQFVNDIIVEAKVNPTSNTYYDMGLILNKNILTNSWHLTETDNLGYSLEAQTVTETDYGYHLVKRISGSRTALTPLIGGGQTLQEIIYQFAYLSDGTLIGQVIFLDGTIWATLQATDTTYLNDNKYIVIWQGEYYQGWGGPSSWDWVRTRKYADTEPSASFGAEEYGLVKGYTTIQVEHILIEHAGIKDIHILDENEEEIIRFENLSNLAEGDIKTRWDWVNDTGKTVRYVIITSLSWTVNKVRL